MKDYKEFTFGWLIFAFVVPIQLLLTYLFVNNLGDKPIGTNGFIAITLILILVCLLFYGLTTRITSHTIVISFGIGLIRKKISLERINSVVTVRSPWYYGWGIRMIPNGILYNISGTAGVELKFNDTKNVVRIGSKDSSRLKMEIERRLS